MQPSVPRAAVLGHIAHFTQSLLARLAVPDGHGAPPVWRGAYAGFDAPTYQRRRIRIAELDTAADAGAPLTPASRSSFRPRPRARPARP